jgi:hypothetical protein
MQSPRQLCRGHAIVARYVENIAQLCLLAKKMLRMFGNGFSSSLEYCFFLRILHSLTYSCSGVEARSLAWANTTDTRYFPLPRKAAHAAIMSRRRSSMSLR